MALTDHNSVKGVREAVAAGKKIGIEVIPTVEMQCDIGEILGYFIDINNKPLRNAMKQSSKTMEDAVKERCKKMHKVGFKISYPEIKKKFPNSKDNHNPFHILFILYKKGYGTPMQLRNIIARKLEKHNLHFRPVKWHPAVKIVKLIRKAGGVPVLAHPWVDPDAIKQLPKLVKAGLKGIELNNGDRAPFRNPKWDKKIKAAAKKYKLIITKGSDYHGEAIKEKMPGNHNLGKNNCDEEVVEELMRKARI
jgi:predicted metal-dependent phosphoesterase TrpH